MVELNKDERRCLRELLSVHRSGGDVGRFIEDRLYSELSHVEDSKSGPVVVGHEGFEDQLDLYRRLAEKGLLFATGGTGYAPRSYGGLTSDGRDWFRQRRTHRWDRWAPSSSPR